MLKFDHKKLIIRNKNKVKRKKLTTINITSDWAPINNDSLDFIIKIRTN